MTLGKTITVNTLGQIIGRLATILFGLLTTAFLTRTLGKAGYGAYGILANFIALFVALADWGTSTIAVREASQNEEAQESIFGTAITLRTIIATFMALGFFVFLPFYAPLRSFSFSFFLSSLIVIYFSLKTSATIIFQTKLKLYYAGLVDAVSSLAFYLFLIFFWVKRGDFSAVIRYLNYSSLIGVFLALVLMLFLAKPVLRLEKRWTRKIILESLPMGAMLAVFSIYNRLDAFLLQIFRGNEETGIYLLAYKVHDNLVLGAAFFMNALFPVISVKSLEDKIQLEKIYKKAFDILLLMVMPLVILFFIFAPLIISLLGGPHFSAAVTVLRILVFATAFAYFNHLTGYTLVALGKQRISFFVAIAALVLNLSLNLIFIPKYSFFAASFITIITEAFVFIVTSFYLRKRMKLSLSFFSFHQTLWQILTERGSIF